LYIERYLKLYIIKVNKISQERFGAERMVKLQFDLNKQYKITLPKALIDAMGWAKGNDIKVSIDSKGNIILSKKGEEEVNG